jgi:hypothetical protein
MDFIVSPGLKLVTRFDALNRIWGGARGEAAALNEPSYSIATRTEEENVAFNLAYIEYASPIGLFNVGYIHDNAWGLTNGFAQSDENGHTTGGIEYILPVGPFYFGGILYKEGSGRYTAVTPATAIDVDWDRYIVFALFNFKGGDVGLMGTYDRIASAKQLGPPFPILTEIYTLQPKLTAKIGPVKVEAMFIYGWGSSVPEPGIPVAHINMQSIDGYLGATVDLGIFYVGGQFAYLSGPGNDPFNVKGGFIGGGLDWNPTLIMFNQDLTYQVGPIAGNGGSSMGSNPGSGTGIGMTNAWFGQLNGGVRPIPKLDIKAAVSYAMADTVPAGWNSDKSYGWELDVTGTYKITNNLSYMLGVGYWWPGKYMEGNSALNNGLHDDYMVLNKLTLTF